jgi:hypothetical protein
MVYVKEVTVALNGRSSVHTVLDSIDTILLVSKKVPDDTESESPFLSAVRNAVPVPKRDADVVFAVIVPLPVFSNTFACADRGTQRPVAKHVFGRLDLACNEKVPTSLSSRPVLCDGQDWKWISTFVELGTSRGRALSMIILAS